MTQNSRRLLFVHVIFLLFAIIFFLFSLPALSSTKYLGAAGAPNKDVGADDVDIVGGKKKVDCT